VKFKSAERKKEKKQQLEQLCKLWHESGTWEEFMVKAAVYGKMSRWQQLLFWTCLQKKEHPRLLAVGEGALGAVPGLVGLAVSGFSSAEWFMLGNAVADAVAVCCYFLWMMAVDELERQIIWHEPLE